MSASDWENWLESKPKGDGPFIMISDSSEDFCCKIDGKVGEIASLLYIVGKKNHAFASAVKHASTFLRKGGEE
jgi:hypothetical protein